MSELRLAANLISMLDPLLSFGHLQIVRVNGAAEEEMEVQAPPLFLLGSWDYPLFGRDHTDRENTPTYDVDGEYAYARLSLGERSADAVWETLRQIHRQFAQFGDRIPYDRDQNSNSYINTVLYMLGIPLTSTLLRKATPEGIDSFPGSHTNVLLNGAASFGFNLVLSAGPDYIRTGFGNDVILGATGNDVLDGGGGYDQLYGGADFDTYFVDGGDTIGDTDGAGLVIWNGRPLTGGSRTPDGEPNVYQSFDGAFRYLLDGANLIVSDVVTSFLVFIEGYVKSASTLGIVLYDSPGEEPEALVGEYYQLPPGDSEVIAMTDGPDVFVSVLPAPHTILAGDGDDTLYLGIGFWSPERGLKENALRTSRPIGSYEVYGGAGDDGGVIVAYSAQLFTGPGDDTFYLSVDTVGQTTVSLGDGDDTLHLRVVPEPQGFGGASNLIEGGPGNDLMETSYAPDTFLISRGDGFDLIVDHGRRDFPVNDRILFGPGISPDDTLFTRDIGSDLFISIDAATRVTVRSHFQNHENDIEFFEYADGTVLSAGEVMARTIGIYDMTETDDIIPGGPLALGGSPFADRYYGRGGNDQIRDDWGGSDFFDGGSGDDSLAGGNGGDYGLLGGSGDDQLSIFNAWGSSYLDGGPGDDSVGAASWDASASATLIGGSGNDTLGSDGNISATMYYNRGDGFDAIDPKGANDRLVFDSGITSRDVRIYTNGRDIFLSLNTPIGTQGDGMVLHRAFDDGTTVEQLQFVDGSLHGGAVWNLAAGLFEGIRNKDHFIGGPQSSRYYAFGGNDAIYDWYGGDDYIDAGAGNDLIGVDLGQDTVLAGPGDDIITLGAGGGQGFYDGGAGEDVFRLTGVEATLTSYGKIHTFRGGPGNDTFTTGASSDTYIFERGDGSDTISDYGPPDSSGPDAIVFGAGITPDHLRPHRIGTNLYIDVDLVIEVMDAAGDSVVGQLTLKNQYAAGPHYYIEAFRFADGTSLPLSRIKERATATVIGGNSADILGGGVGNDTIAGLGGDDVISDTLGGFDSIEGGPGADTITSANALDAADTVKGGAGNDLIRYGGRHDHLSVYDGGEGDDTFTVMGTFLGEISDVHKFIGGPGDDSFNNGSAQDTYVFDRGDGHDTIKDDSLGYPGTDVIAFGPGITLDDFVVTREGSDILIRIAPRSAGAEDDALRIVGAAQSDRLAIERYEFTDGTALAWDDVKDMASTLSGTAGADTLQGSEYVDFIFSGGGDDRVDAGAGDDRVHGEDGSDFLEGGAGRDDLHGDAGDDTLYGGADGDTLDGGEASDRLFGGLGPDVVAGGGGDDLLEGNEDADTLDGGDGSDSLHGGDGTDTLRGGRGADLMDAGPGDDVYLLTPGDGMDTLMDPGGYDEIALPAGITRDDLLFSFDARTAQTQVLFLDRTGLPLPESGFIILGEGSPDTLIEALVFADGSRVALASPASVRTGTAGADTITMGNSNASVFAGDGADTITIAGSSPVIDGQNGDDVIKVQYGGGATILGGHGNDSITAGSGADTLFGGHGNDAIDSGGGDDLVSGGTGDDSIVGGAGADTLRGGAGNDRLTGGAGSDRFVFDVLPDAGANVDRISDFEVNDRIVLHSSIFTPLAPGRPSSTSFRAGPGLNASIDADDYLLFDTVARIVFYDADGAGDHASPVPVVGLGGLASVSVQSFEVI